ncbi:MAG TPA: Crp/Fnr family transcriptional regulator [Terriglobales bacterium]|nr:Crp/Fnr family transcriptional regulator [Terriglobales bacterium]
MSHIQHADRAFASPADADPWHDLNGTRQVRRYPEGAVLFEEGRMAEGALLVRSGRVKLSVSSPRGKTLLLEVAGPGEMLGLSAVLSGRPHEVTACAISPVEAVFFPRQEFLHYLEDHPDACLRVVSLLTTDLDAAYDRVRNLHRR